MNRSNLPSGGMARFDEPIIEVDELTRWVRDARERTFDLVADLSDEQLMGPRLSIVNPMLWEIGHTAWFEEKWVLRHTCHEKPIRADADALYDSIAIPHDTRWDLPLPSRKETIDYMCRVRDRVLEKLEAELDAPAPDERLLYFALYCVYHADMHNEAFTYTRQTLGYPAPHLSGGSHVSPSASRAAVEADSALRGDAEIPGGEILLGSSQNEPFVFDNEKWAHPVKVAPFAMARVALTQGEFLCFVEDNGYRRQDLWSEPGWKWREAVRAEMPLYWKRERDGILRRHFDRWVPLEEHLPVIHVNCFEAEAYCRWARRRLPTEAEWELAASSPQIGVQTPAQKRRRYTWGNEAPTSDLANLDWQRGGCADVREYPGGDSVFGCRQMLGNVWEWTSTPFLPYPGFVADPYKEYSEPWFATHRVLRGGAWATRSRLVRNQYRNFYTPDRRDVWAGFRTCRAAG